MLGGALRAIGQPAVIGELAAGVLLGPSVLGHLAPALHQWLFPNDPLQRALLAGPAWIGVFLLLILTGSETDLALIRRLGRATARVAIGSLVLPVLAGVALGVALPAEFVGEGAQREVFALFMGTALGISALPVIAKILSDLDLMRRNIAQVLLAAAMADDIAGWILLGIVAGLAQSGSLDAGRLLFTIVGLGLFLAVAFTVGQRLVDALLRGVLVRRWGSSASLTAVLLVALAAGATTHAIGLEAVFGAFIAGIVLGRSRFHEAEVFAQLDGVTRSFFAPLFFATAGLRVDLGLLRDPEVLGWGLVVLAVASVSKAGGAYLGSRFAGLPKREGLALGVGLNARGAVEIVVATVGLSIGVLNPSSYAHRGAARDRHVDDGAAAAAPRDPRLGGLRGGAGAPRPGAPARRQRARARRPRAAAEPRRAELRAGRAHRRLRLAGGRRGDGARGRPRRPERGPREGARRARGPAHQRPARARQGAARARSSTRRRSATARWPSAPPTSASRAR